MNYSKFTLTRVWKNKFNLIPFFLISIFIIFMYNAYHISAFSVMENPLTSGETEMEYLKEDMIRFEREMLKFDETSLEYQTLKNDYEMAENRLNHIKNRLEAYTDNNWEEYFRSDMELAKITLQVIKVDPAQYNEEFANVLSTYIQYDQYMIDYDLKYDSHFENIQGMRIWQKSSIVTYLSY